MHIPSVILLAWCIGLGATDVQSPEVPCTPHTPYTPHTPRTPFSSRSSFVNRTQTRFDFSPAAIKKHMRAEPSPTTPKPPRTLSTLLLDQAQAFLSNTSAYVAERLYTIIVFYVVLLALMVVIAMATGLVFG
ncbi:hypothetical protein NEDG_02016 [Nematocida displodere]|uniref:Uncharacterized protein n=1 Tax=Nematocida displodere TaxID=1805483 RepID=A0A177EET5_9MICR|nr:hypothetical protein NEDG_02016 [Nematocida displodere]